MKYFTDKIEEVLKSNTVATAAGFISGAWTNHVFIRFGEEEMVGNMSIGRLPAITVREAETDYAFEAEPEHNGSRTCRFVIRIYVPTFINRSEERWQLLQKIKQAAMSELTKQLSLGATDMLVGAAVITQCSIYQEITLTTNSSYDQLYAEGN